MSNSSLHCDVVHVVQRMAPGGIETLVRELVMSDPRRIMVVSLEGTVASLIAAWPVLRSIESQIIALDRRPGLSGKLVWRLVQVLRRVQPKIVFAHHIGPLLYGGLAARITRVRSFVHVEHDVWHYASPRSRTITRLAQWIARPRHVAVSEHAANAIRALLPHAELTVIHNGVDIRRFTPGNMRRAREVFGIAESGRIVGTAGRLVEVKGHAILVQATVALPADVHVVIAGSGPCRDALERQARDLGVASRITFLGHVDGIEALLPAFDVFCLPSFAEGFPRAVIEAQACGLPVVATAVGGLGEAVCERSGRLVPTNDPTALARALCEVLSRPDPTAARAFVSNRFPWERTHTSYLSLMEPRHVA